jgi:hypothetical protein
MISLMDAINLKEIVSLRVAENMQEGGAVLIGNDIYLAPLTFALITDYKKGAVNRVDMLKKTPCRIIGKIHKTNNQLLEGDNG